jgi:hypothetical protein
MRSYLILICVWVAATRSPAAVVVLCNHTTKPVAITVTVGTAAPVAMTLAVRQTVPITCGKTVEVAFSNAEGPQRRPLEPWAAYLFQEKEKEGLDLRGIILPGKGPGHDDVPAEVAASKTLVIPVKVLVDDADRRTRLAWGPAMKARFDKANAVLEKAANVRFDIAAEGEWKSDPKADLTGLAAEFEKGVTVKPQTLAIGFTSRPFLADANNKPTFDGFSVYKPALHPHRVIRENDPRNEPERIEVLVAQLSRHLGGVTSPDDLSSLRPFLGDGKALLVKFEVNIDPVNTLIMNIWADALRAGPVAKLDDLTPPMQVRLARLYGMLNQVLPEEPLSEPVAALLEKSGLRAAVVPPVVPMNGVPAAAVAKGITPEQEAVRKVVRGVTIAAEDNARKPANARVKGDDLADLYIRTAADIAVNLEPNLRKRAFLYGIGIAMDDSMVLRDKPLLGDWCKAAESDDERKQRLAVLGTPTLRFRRDSCQHFVISAALTEFGGAVIAEQVGILKEQSDMARPGGSGFSFADIAADLAGIQLALTVQAGGETLATLRAKFKAADYVPKLDDLPDGLSKEKFKQHYGDTKDERYKAQYDECRKRIQDLPAYKKP